MLAFAVTDGAGFYTLHAPYGEFKWAVSATAHVSEERAITVSEDRAAGSPSRLARLSAGAAAAAAFFGPIPRASFQRLGPALRASSWGPGTRRRRPQLSLTLGGSRLKLEAITFSSKRRFSHDDDGRALVREFFGRV